MNKLLVSFFIPKISAEFDAYIPINRKIGTIKKYLIDIIKEKYESNVNFDEMLLIDSQTGIEYQNNLYVRDTEIKNGSKVIIL